MTPTNSRNTTLSDEQRNALEAEILRSFAGAKKPVAQHRDRSAPCPLSYAQESVWFFDQLKSNSPLYNIPQAFRLRGPLDTAALQKAFDAVVQRHEALRTKFICINEKPMQVVQDRPFQLEVLDASTLSETEREKELEKLLRNEATRPFKLDEDLMLRATLLRFSETDHVLTLSLHHIVSDFGSLAVLYRELAALYDAFRSGKSSPLPALSSQFADFIFCQRERLKNGLPQKHLEHWKKTLDGDLPVLQLPTDRPRPSQQTFRGSRLPIHISTSLAASLKSFCREQGVTPYMALLSAFKLLLHRYSSQEDIIVGVPIGERTNADTENLIGFFINTLPIRTDISGNPTFKELLQRVRQSTLGTFAHGEIAFEKLVEELRLPRESGCNPVFQTVFQLLTTESPKPELPAVVAEILPMETGTAKFDLTFTLVESNDGFVGDLEYNSDLFESATVARMLQHFKILLEAAIAHPGKNISALPLLSEVEYEQVIHGWNETRSECPRNSSIHDLFAEQVEKTPEAVAIVFGDERLTYRELNDRSNQVAHYLQKLGVRPDSLVGICMERSAELIISLLGILKAGGAYVPLDANYPPERLTYMLKDTGASVLLTTSKFKTSFPGSTKIICVDEEQAVISSEVSSNPETTVSGNNLAYVIYTSGSTGKPKGVAIPHRGVVRLVKNTNYLSFSTEDVFLQFAPISFDASTLEIWGPLLNGGKLAIFPPQFDSIEQLGDALQHYKVTALWLTAGLFHQVVEHHIHYLGNVKYLLAGGDVLSVPHVLKVLRELPQTTLINGYGPTENTTFTCCYAIPKNWEGKSVPIGRPISNTQVYILDKYLAPVPVGVHGELYIGGDGLAREYLNSAELTKQKFVANPFSSEADAKLYKTGDVVRWMPDGNIEFIGRSDNQVKVRGFRVELSEIENAINTHGSVQETIIVAKSDSSGTKSLLAYFVLNSQTPADVTEIRAFVEQRLPGYMVPQHFIVLEKFPLTPNGKVDRRLLPDPVETKTSETSAPRNPMEEAICKIWCEVLNLAVVGINDNFFSLGGHSLLATRIVSRINEAFGANLSIAAMFERPTVAALSQAVQTSGQKENDAPITRRSRRKPSPQPSHEPSAMV